MKNVLVITDNQWILDKFLELVKDKESQVGAFARFYYAYSPVNQEMSARYSAESWIFPVNMKKDWSSLVGKYELILSLHCKQLFPSGLVSAVRCINVHPGLNPHNRGWYPQVFSILNGLPCGATIHEMDNELDHGPVICQKEVQIKAWDNSLSVYTNVLAAELELLQEYLVPIVKHEYAPREVAEGNINLKKDFEKLCRIDLDNRDTFQNHINRLRALTHGKFLNAYFLDDTGKKVFIRMELTPEQGESA